MMVAESSWPPEEGSELFTLFNSLSKSFEMVGQLEQRTQTLEAKNQKLVDQVKSLSQDQPDYTVDDDCCSESSGECPALEDADSVPEERENSPNIELIAQTSSITQLSENQSMD